MDKYTISDMPPCLTQAIPAALEGVETATLGHVRHWGFLDCAIQPLGHRRRVVGCAVTLALPAQDSTLLHHAAGLLRPGDVLVIDRLGDTKHACLGGALNQAVSCGGVNVSAEDVVIADENGVLIVPRHEAEALGQAAKARQARAQANLLKLRSGQKLGDLSGASRHVEADLQQG